MICIISKLSKGGNFGALVLIISKVVPLWHIKVVALHAWWLLGTCALIIPSIWESEACIVHYLNYI